MAKCAQNNAIIIINIISAQNNAIVIINIIT